MVLSRYIPAKSTLLYIVFGVVFCLFPGYFPLHASDRLPAPSDTLPVIIPILLSAVFFMPVFFRRGRKNRDEINSPFRLLCDYAGDMMFICDKQDRIIYANPAACSLLGYRQEQFRALPALDLFHPSDRQFVRQEIDGMLKGRVEPREIHLLSGNGDLLEAECRIFRLDRENGGSIGFVLRETSGRRKNEMLSRIQQDWEQTFNSIADMISVHDQDFRVIKANRALADFLGRPQEEIIGRKCHEVFHNAGEPVAMCPFVKALETGNPASAEIRDYYLGVPLFITCSPFFDESGQFKGAVHVVRIMENHDRTKSLDNGSGLIPVCASCKDIRQGKDTWIRIEDFVHLHYGCRFTHSICQKCRQKLYPELVDP